MFLPHIMAGQNAIGQTALHTLARSQARSGLAGTRFGGSQQLGLSAMLGNQGLQQAFQQAFGLAGQRASAWTGMSLPQVQPNYNLGNALQSGISAGILAQALRGNSGRGQAPGSNWTVGGVPYYIARPPENPAGPTPYDPGSMMLF